MRYRQATSRLFILLLLCGGAWIGLTYISPTGWPALLGIFVLGTGFDGTYVSLLITRIRQIFHFPQLLARALSVIALNLAILLCTFAWVYQVLGMLHNTLHATRVVHDFSLALYYSVATFTTLGYGDFYPVGMRRALAALVPGGLRSIRNHRLDVLFHRLTPSAAVQESRHNERPR